MIDKNKYLSEISNAKTLNQIKDIHTSLFGKNGIIKNAFKSLPDNVKKLHENLKDKIQEFTEKCEESKKQIAAELNKIKTELEEAISKKHKQIELSEINDKLQKDKIDVTLPFAPEKQIGLIHPFNRVVEEVCEIFSSMGFSYAEGPHIESDFYNFTALNIPDHHPARQSRDSFYLLNSENLLRTETSAVQIRTMEKQKAPVKIFAPGSVFRNESDATHVPMFHQLEGLWVDEDITMKDLLSVLVSFLKEFFCTDNAPIRIRQHNFPFTEPSVEIDVKYERKNGQIKIGQGDKWLEILGGGMVHPNVLKNVNIDPSKYQGFAFGTGIERLAMLKYGMPDVREFYNSDINWLKHYGFKPYNNPNSQNGLN